MGFFRVLIVSVLIFYAFSLIIRKIFDRRMNKFKRQMQEQFSPEEPTQTKGKTNPHVDPNIGEYTDFEEIN